MTWETAHPAISLDSCRLPHLGILLIPERRPEKLPANASQHLSTHRPLQFLPHEAMEAAHLPEMMDEKRPLFISTELNPLHIGSCLHRVQPHNQLTNQQQRCTASAQSNKKMKFEFDSTEVVT